MIGKTYLRSQCPQCDHARALLHGGRLLGAIALEIGHRGPTAHAVEQLHVMQQSRIREDRLELHQMATALAQQRQMHDLTVVAIVRWHREVVHAHVNVERVRFGNDRNCSEQLNGHSAGVIRGSQCGGAMMVALAVMVSGGF